MMGFLLLLLPEKVVTMLLIYSMKCHFIFTDDFLNKDSVIKHNIVAMNLCQIVLETFNPSFTLIASSKRFIFFL